MYKCVVFFTALLSPSLSLFPSLVLSATTTHKPCPSLQHPTSLREYHCTCPSKQTPSIRRQQVAILHAHCHRAINSSRGKRASLKCLMISPCCMNSFLHLSHPSYPPPPRRRLRALLLLLLLLVARLFVCVAKERSQAKYVNQRNAIMKRLTTRRHLPSFMAHIMSKNTCVMS